MWECGCLRETVWLRQRRHARRYEHRDEAPLCRSLVTINEVLGSMPDDVQHARVKGGERNRVAEVLVVGHIA